MTDIDPRILFAYRKTEDSRRVFVENEYGAGEANLSNNCLKNSISALPELWEETVYDHLDGGLVHARTKKMFYAEKLLSEWIYQLSEGDRLRKPTDIIVVTDGFCASGCAIFTYNAIRAGSAIVAGYGGTYENDTLFAAGQCFATTIAVHEWLNDFANNTDYGLEFGVSFAEMYNISENMDEIIPNEFDVPRIDFHLNYFEGANPNLDDIIARTIKLHKDSNTTCNPKNKNLIFITDDCHVDDPQALAVGYVCGDDGFWNKSTCKILSCQPMYSLDYVHNKCIPNVCDGRSALITSSGSGGQSSNPSDSGSGDDTLYVALIVTGSILGGILVIVGLVFLLMFIMKVGPFKGRAQGGYSLAADA